MAVGGASRSAVGSVPCVDFWLVRHGETFANFDRIIQGHQGGELTDKGQEQAKKIGMRLQDEPFDLVCVSDLNRTR